MFLKIFKRLKKEKILYNRGHIRRPRGLNKKGGGTGVPGGRDDHEFRKHLGYKLGVGGGRGA